MPTSTSAGFIVTAPVPSAPGVAPFPVSRAEEHALTPVSRSVAQASAATVLSLRNDIVVTLRPGPHRLLRYDSLSSLPGRSPLSPPITTAGSPRFVDPMNVICLLYTSDAADDLLCVDLG